MNNISNLQAECDDFNAANPIGSPVFVALPFRNASAFEKMRSGYEKLYRTDWNDSSPLAQQEREIWQAAWEAATAAAEQGVAK